MASASLRATLRMRPLLFGSSRYVFRDHYLRTLSTSGTRLKWVELSQNKPLADVRLVVDRSGDDANTESKLEGLSKTESPVEIAPPIPPINIVDSKIAHSSDISESTSRISFMLPVDQWNFFQKLVFPYTASVLYYLDFLLNYLPWWQSIMVLTTTARLVFFPLILKQNIMGIKTLNLLPQTQKLQVKLHESMVNQDAYNTALTKAKITILNKEHGLSMKDRLMPIFIQAPMYATIFFTLRKLTAIPYEGMSTGGILWFTNLALPDPYYILPMMTSATMFLLLEYGLEGSSDPKKAMGPIGRFTIRSIPLLMFFFFQNFPAATLLFWTTSNSMTLFYALALKTAWAKKKFNIPDRLVHDPKDLPLSQLTFKDQYQAALDKGANRRTSADIRRLDDIAFRKAGVGPLRKTFKDPS